MIVVILALVGLCLGSFVNASVWRLHEQQEQKYRTAKRRGRQNLSIVTGRSMCPHCRHLLATKDLIPVVSYLWLRGKCRYCGKPIDDTPLAELLVPSLFVPSYLWWPYNLANAGLTFGRVFFGIWLACLVMFVILALYDFKWQLLPDRVVFPLIGLTAILVAVHVVAFHGSWPVLGSALWGVVFSAGLFYAIYLLSKGQWIGFGDVKLAIALGLLVGGPLGALMLLFLASFLGSLAAVPLMARGIFKAQAHIPFGPFLLLTTVIIVLFGTTLSSWYLGLITA